MLRIRTGAVVTCVCGVAVVALLGLAYWDALPGGSGMVDDAQGRVRENDPLEQARRELKGMQIALDIALKEKREMEQTVDHMRKQEAQRRTAAEAEAVLAATVSEKASDAIGDIDCLSRTSTQPRFLVVWRAAVFEDSWIFHMFKGVCFDLMHDQLPTTFHKHVILVANKRDDVSSWLDHVASHNWTYNEIDEETQTYKSTMDFFHLSDELFNVVFFGKFYAKGLFRSIFRNYWSDHKYGPPYTNAEHVKWLPLGWTPGYGPISSSLITPASTRRYNITFLGQEIVSEERKKYLPKWKEDARLDFHSEISKGFMKGLNVPDYRAFMLNSIIVPNLKGVNDDCYRLWEALEAGCIPVVKRSEKFHWIGVSRQGQSSDETAPFPLVDSFDEFEDVALSLLSDPVRLDAVQASSYAWWSHFKRSEQRALRTILLSKIRRG